jgi:pimeloyl-ACP methyl ester carboxylesterase
VEEAEALQAGTDFPLMIEMMVEVCETWPRGDDPVYFRQLEESDVPTLILSGEADPITPPRYAELAAAYFPNSQHIRVPGYGHDVLSVPCMASVVTDFISGEPDPNLDAACLDEVEPPPFFVNPAGPKP